eukprot:4075365-Pyramimonas_sp.AAC.1
MVRTIGFGDLQGLHTLTKGLNHGLHVQGHAQTRVGLEGGTEVGRHFQAGKEQIGARNIINHRFAK